VACAAALATLAVYERERIFDHAAAMAPAFEAAVHSLRGRRHVIDVRNIGLMAGIDLTPRAGTPGARGYEALVRAFEAGLMVRPTGDTIALSPPLIVSEEQIGRIVEVLGDVFDAIE
jgi:beta-alanine--pyruvate transaminase